MKNKPERPGLSTNQEGQVRLLRELADTREALEAQTEFLNAIVDSIDTGIVACDAGGVLTYFNRAMRELHGQPEKLIPPERWAASYGLKQSDGITPMRLEDIALYRALHGETVRNVESVILTREGRRRTVVSTARPIVSRSGRRLGAVVAITDVTEQRAAERKIRQSELFLDSIIENIPDMIFVKDASELRFVRFNRAGEALIGRSREELIGKNDHDFFPKEQADAFTEKDRAALERGEVIDIPEEPISTPNGQRILHTKKIPVFNPDGSPAYLLGISEDITVKKQAEEQQVRLRLEQRARADAEAFNHELRKERQLREEFVTTLSHDLRNPLAAAKTLAEALKRYPTDEGTRTRLLNSLAASLERAEHMILDLLDANRIRAGESLPMKVTPCDLSAIAASVIESESLVRGREIRLTAPDACPGVWSESGLRRAVENLIENACKYGRAGTPVSVRVDRGEWDVRVSVHNEGEPIPPSEQARIFEGGQRAQTSIRSGKKGWGLGLLLVRGIAEAHGGTVSVESSLESGTTFTVILPVDTHSRLRG